MNLLINNTDAQNYLEIGCQEDNLFNSVPVNNKVGVDPEMGGNKRMTSDDFFSENKQSFDVIFIDGMHTYEQVRKDIINALKCLNPGGWISLHDLLPGTWVEAHVPNISQGAWFGDVWKIAFELCQTTGIEFKVVKIDAGVGVLKVTGEPVFPLEMKSSLEEAQFDYFCKNISRLPVVNWPEAYEWIKGPEKV